MSVKSRFYVRSPDGTSIYGFAKAEAAEVAAIEYGDGAFIIDTEARMYEPMLQKIINKELVYFGVSGWNTDKKSDEGNLVEGIKNGQVAIVHAYLARGAVLNATDKNGGTPLHWAAAACKADIVALLLEHGANPDTPDNDGETPLQLAKNCRKAAVLEVFTKKIKKNNT